MQTAPAVLDNSFIYYTDQNSLLRGLNAFNGPMRSSVRTIRVDKSGSMFSASAFFNFLRFGMIASATSVNLSTESQAVSYDENEDKITFLRFLTGDSKEALLIKEDLDAKEHLARIFRAEESMFKAGNQSQYKDLLSALVDSYQVNFGVVYLLHHKEDLIVLNRIMIPAKVKDEEAFEFYTKFFNIGHGSSGPLTAATNFVQVHRRDLIISGAGKISALDLSQMILPVIHLKA